MSLLLDTHALLWWLEDHPRLGRRARTLVENAANAPHVSVVSLWEIAVKVRTGKMRADVGRIAAILRERGVRRLDIEDSHLAALVQLPSHHRDPFDDLLIAQAIAEKFKLVTHDQALTLYPVEVIAAGK